MPNPEARALEHPEWLFTALALARATPNCCAPSVEHLDLVEAIVAVCRLA
jgi:hypothetical protein